MVITELNLYIYISHPAVECAVGCVAVGCVVGCVAAGCVVGCVAAGCIAVGCVVPVVWELSMNGLVLCIPSTLTFTW